MVEPPLAGGIPTPLKNDGVSSSVGMMTFPIYGDGSKSYPPGEHQNSW